MTKQLPGIAILAIFSIFLSGCGNSNSSSSEEQLAIGSLGPGGGVIFEFLDDTNTQGLEVYTAAFEEQSVWGCLGVNVDPDPSRARNGVNVPSGATSSEVLRMANSTGICLAEAAEATFGFSNNDRNDWYLPSTDELIKIRELGLLPGEPGDPYWSATEDTDQNAFMVFLRVPENPLDNGNPSTNQKSNTANVIPIRTFVIE